MNVSDIRIRKIQDDVNKLRGIASITIDECFAIHDIKIIEGSEGMFIAMPSRKTKEGDYKDVAHPINKSTRQKLSDIILEAFKKTV